MRLADAILILAIVGVGAGGLLAEAGDLPADGDLVRDLLFALDCSRSGECHTAGAAATAEELRHGGTWLSFAALIQWLGGDAAAVQLGVIGVTGLAVGLLGWVTLRFGSRADALAAAGLYAAGLLALDSHLLLWNRSLLPLFSTATSVAVLALARTGRVSAAVAAGAFLGLGVGAHLGVAGLAPVALFAVVAWARHPVRATLAMGVVLAILAEETSSRALRIDAAWLAADRRWVLAASAFAGVVALGMTVRERLGKSAPAVRDALVLAVAVIPVGTGALLIRGELVGGELSREYLHLVLPVGAYTVGRTLARLGSRWWAAAAWAPAAVAAGAAGIILERPAPPTTWTLEEIRAVAQQVQSEGLAFETLKLGVQGPGCYPMIHGLALHAAPPNPERSTDRRSVLVVRVDPKQAPPTDLGRVLHAGPRRVAVRTLAGWLDPRNATVCYEPAGTGGMQPICRALPADPRETGRGRFLYANRSYPEAHPIFGRGDYWVRYTFPVRPSGDRKRFIRVIDPDPDCRWKITRVEGLRSPTPLPAREVELEAASRDGEITVAKRYGAAGCPREDERFPPCLAETLEAEDWIRRHLPEAP